MRVAPPLFVAVFAVLLAGCGPSVAELVARGAWPEVIARSARMRWEDPERACAIDAVADALDATVTLEALWTAEGCETCADDVPEALFLVRVGYAPVTTDVRFGSHVSQGRQSDRAFQSVISVTSRSDLRAVMHLHADPSAAGRALDTGGGPPDSLGRALLDVATLGLTRDRPTEHDESVWDRMTERVCATIGCDAAFERVSACNADADSERHGGRTEACSLLAVYRRDPSLRAVVSFTFTFSLPEGRWLDLRETVPVEGATFVEALRPFSARRLAALRANGSATCPTSPP